MKIERNEPCPCGSGKKYKRCCALKHGAGMSQTTMVLLAVAVVGGALALFAMINTDAGGSTPRRVWSADHGHYHDVP